MENVILEPTFICDAADGRKAVMFKDTIDPGVGDFDVVIARQIPDDKDRPKVILAPQIKHFLDDLSWHLIGRVLRNRFGILQPSFATLLICFAPSIKTGPADPKIPAGFTSIADLLHVLKHLKFALNVAFFVRHEYFLHPKSGNLQEVF